MASAAQHAQVILRADPVVIYRYDQEKRDVLLPPTYVGVNHPAELLETGKFHYSSVVLELISAEQGVQYISKAREDDRERLQQRAGEGELTFVEREGVVSSARLRLEATGEIVGVLFVNYRTPHAFDEAERQMIELFASQTAVALQNALRYEQLSVAIERQKAVSEVGTQLTANIHLSEAEILGLLHEQASRVMDTKNMYIALYDKPADTVRFPLAYLNGQRVDTAAKQGWQPRTGGRGRTEWIIRNRQPLLDKTLAESESWYDAPGRKEYIGQAFTSWVGVPMIVGDHVLGVIATYHPDRENVYGEDDVQVLSMMAGYAAIALDNARLLQELANRLMELGKLRELSEELSTGVWLGGE